MIGMSAFPDKKVWEDKRTSGSTKERLGRHSQVEVVHNGKAFHLSLEMLQKKQKKYTKTIHP